MTLKPEFICPYCFEKSKLKHAEFKCTYQKCSTFGKDMENYFPVTQKSHISSFPVSGVCPECGHTSYKLVCPNCKSPLPESTLNGKDLIISIVGGVGTGKTCYVGVIIKEMIERVAPAFDGALIGFDDTTKRYYEEFESVLYGGKPHRPEKTHVDKESKPLIYTLSLKQKGFLRSTINSFTFVFFDTAGENLSDEETMNTVTNYIRKSAGVLFLLDPTVMGNVRDQLSEEILNGASTEDPKKVEKDADEIMKRVYNMLRQEHDIHDMVPSDVPVAVVFSKFDAIASLIPEGATILNPSPHCKEGKFILSDAEAVNGEIQSLLKEWGAAKFITQVETFYKTSSFFAASAFGLNNNPDRQGFISRPKPHRIEDAMLWLMMKNGAIPSSK